MMRRRGASELLPITSVASTATAAASVAAPIATTTNNSNNKKTTKRKRKVSSCCYFYCFYITILLITLAAIFTFGWSHLTETHKQTVQDKINHYQGTYKELSKQAKAKAMALLPVVLGNTQDYYQHAPGLLQLINNKPPAVNDNHVVIITISDGTKTFVQLGSSPTSAANALQTAQAKLPKNTNAFPFIKIDLVTGVKRYTDFNYFEPIQDTPSAFYGIALDWDKEWVFLPEEVHANALVDSGDILRLEHVANYAHQIRKLNTWALPPDYTDDSTTMDVLDIFHTESIFIEYGVGGSAGSADTTTTTTSTTTTTKTKPTFESVSLYHGHRIFSQTAITSKLLSDAANEAGMYLLSSIKDTGRFVYKYNPRSNYEPFGYSLSRHAGTLYSMATLLKDHHDNTNHDNTLDGMESAMQLAMDYLLAQINDCTVPYSTTTATTTNAKCVVDYELDNHSISKLDANAFALLAILAFMDATKNTPTTTTQQRQSLLDTCKAIATFIVKSQRDDGSFCHKVRLNGGADGKQIALDEHYIGAPAPIPLALALLHKELTTSTTTTTDSIFIDAAVKATSYIVAQESTVVDHMDVTIHHWLLSGIAALPPPLLQDAFVDHVLRAIHVAQQYQTKDEGNDELDMVGVYYDNVSSTASATKVQGLCAVHDLVLAKGKTEEAAMLLESVTLSMRYQLQTQYRPEQAMYMKDPNRILGGFHDSLYDSRMRIDFTQHNLSSMLCVKRLLDWKSRAS